MASLFFVAAPTTTLDPKTASGADIPIEERPADELCCLKVNGDTHRVTPDGIKVWNPAFDVTPAALITGVVTEQGLVPQSSEPTTFDVPALFAKADSAASGAAKRRKLG